MRQILIEKNDLIKDMNGSKMEFLVTKNLGEIHIEPNETKVVNFPFKLNTISGGKIDLSFSLPKRLAEMGIILIGSYVENDEITVFLHNLESGRRQYVPEGECFLIGTLIEVCFFKQVETEKSVPVVTKKKKK